MNTMKLNPSKIIGLQFGVLSPDEIRNGSVANIHKRDTYINNKPVVGGLFDPRMGVSDPGLICPTDGHDYMTTPGYFGHIELAKPVFYIQFIHTIIKVLRCICIKCSKLRLNKENHMHILKLSNKDRWDYVFKRASKIFRCGDDCEDGCNTEQPKKIIKEGFANIVAEFNNIDGIPNNEGVVLDVNKRRIYPEDVIRLFSRISDDDINFMGFSSIWSRPEWFVCQVLAVPPPAVRPSVKHDAQQRSEDDLSHIIVNIIKSNEQLKKKIDEGADNRVIEDWRTVLQYYTGTLVDNNVPGSAPVQQRSGRPLKAIKDRLKGKQGRVRGNLMGKRVDFSARSVITPDPNIGIAELGVPKKIAMTTTFPQKVTKRNMKFLNKLIINGPDKYPGANILTKKEGNNISLRYVDRNTISLKVGDIVHRHLLNGDKVLFNRQPTLHRMSMMCHMVRVMEQGKTFRMNVADTKPYNADFDGDEMNMHAPQNQEAVSELTNLAAVQHQLISPANNSSIVGIFQDSLLSSYRFTRSGINFNCRTAMNLLMRYNKLDLNMFKRLKMSNIVTNFDMLTQIIPDLSMKMKNKSYGNNKDENSEVLIKNGEYVRGQIDKSILGKNSKGLIQRIYNDYGHEQARDFIDDLQNLVTEYMKLSGYSVGISDLIADDDTNNKITETVKKKKEEVLNLSHQLHLNIFDNNSGKSNKVEFENRVNSILNNANSEAGKIGRNSLSKDNKFVIMVKAGSKGSDINLAQMISGVGQQNVDSKRIPYGFEDRTLPHFKKFDDSPEARGFVENSFIQGLSPQELYFHAMGGRTGLIDTAVKTSGTGYIQRRLIKGMEDLKLNYDMTVRNNKNKVIQFQYGDDGINPCKIENQSLKLVSLSIEDIYMHFQIINDMPLDEIFNESARKRMKSKKTNQSNKLKERTQKTIEYMIRKKHEIINNVFNNKNEDKVSTSVNFERIIYNIKNNKLSNNSYVDITPYEYLTMIDKAWLSLKLAFNTKPTELFKVLWCWYLSPVMILIKYRFNKNQVINLLNTLKLNYEKSIMHPGEMVGMIAAQSIGEPTTQLTLNTFHFAGVASKSNVTRGVPRVEEILSTSENPKNPSMTIYLKDNDDENFNKAKEIKSQLEYTSLRDITKSVGIYFEPKTNKTNIHDDEQLINEFLEFESMFNRISGIDNNVNDNSKWVIRLELMRDIMMDKNITMNDIDFVIKNSTDNIKCIFSDFNANNLVFRLKIDITKFIENKKNNVIDQSDHVNKLKQLQNELLDNIILKGVKKIKKVIIRKVSNNVKEINKKDMEIKNINGEYKPAEIWVLDTIGTNLTDILSNDLIDYKKTITNDIQETYRVLGIEAARQCIYNEMFENFDANGTYINYHHLSMLCDRMCATKKMVSIFRHGINNDDIGPIAKASFEETPEMFLRAAKHGELDLMTGVSANIMCGQRGYYGTGAFDILLNLSEMKKLESKLMEQQENINDILNINNNEICSLNNININHNVTNILNKDSGNIDDDYTPGF